MFSILTHLIKKLWGRKNCFEYLICNKIIFLVSDLCKQKIQTRRATRLYSRTCHAQGTGIMGKEMALVWHEKDSRTALQTNSVLHTHAYSFGTDTQHDYSQGIFFSVLISK